MANALHPEVQYSLIKNFARQTPINVTVTTAAIAFVSWMVWPYVPLWMSLPWVIAHIGLPAVIFIRWQMRRAARQRSGTVPPPPVSIEIRARRSGQRAIIFALYSGVMWGLTAFALPYLPDRYDVALIVIVGALAGGATTTLSAIPLAAGAYALTSVVPFSIYFFAQGADPASISLGTLALVMSFAMVWASRSVHGTYLDDIAARVAATQKLDELLSAREDWLQVAQTADAFALFDEHKRIKFRNSAFISLLAGPDPKSPAGETFASLVARLVPSEETSIGILTQEEREQRYLHQQDQPDEPLVERLADGRWVRSMLRRTASGSMVWLIQDITSERSRETTEIKLRARLAEAKQLQTIGQFAGGVAHDFNNVLGAIQAFAEFITLSSANPDGQKSAAQRIIKACERGAGMVRNVMQLATASRIEKETFRVGNAFQQAVSLLAARKPDAATFDVQDNMGNAYIDANESQIVQLIMNLVVNAFSALNNNAGQVNLRASCIDVDTTVATQFFDAAADLDGVTEALGGGHQYVFGMLLPEKPYVKIVVEDSGTGIEPEFLPRMFDPFISTKDTTMRTGFGLAVVRSVVMASEGALCVRSAPGKGTTFEVYIACVAAPHAAREGDALTQTGSEMSLNSVLIVDDDIDAADGLALALTGLGHRVRAIYDPRVALDEVTRNPGAWPVMVIDVSMPGMNGDELATQVRKLSPLTRMFLYSGRTSDALRATAAKIGVESVLQKPIDPRALSTMIDQRS